MEFIYKRRYLKMASRHPAFIQERILEAENEIKEYCRTARASFGLRIKKLGGATYEARVNSSLRIILIKEDARIIFALVGNHEEVRRYLLQ